MCDIQDTAQETPTFYNDLGHISSVEPVCELLNDLSDKIDEQQVTINNFEKLFSETIGVADTSKLLETGDYEIKRMFVRELIENLQKENEQLQKQLEQTDFALHRSHLQVKKLKDENEQLRKENAKFKEMMNVSYKKIARRVRLDE